MPGAGAGSALLGFRLPSSETLNLMDSKLSYKFNKLKKILKDLESCVLAYSGGVDSTLLMKVAKDILGKNLLAVTARSQTYPESELEFAKDIAKKWGVKHLIVKTNELKNKNFIENPLQRCFYCKRELFFRLKRIAQQKKFKNVIDAVNAEDKLDFRPGLQAAKIMKVRSPLDEARLGKKEIYALSKHFNLPTKLKPSLACLASRFPYGEKITAEKLFMVGQMESFIKSLGADQIRVRHHGAIARIEVDKNSLNRIMKSRTLIVNRAKSLGYNYVSLDLEGYRTGSLNEVIKQ